MEHPLKQRSKKALLIFLVLYPITIGGALIFAGFMLVAFNGFPSANGLNMLPWRITMSLLGFYPILVIGCMLIAGLRYWQTHYRSAFNITLIPLFSIPITFFIAILAFIVASL